MKSLLLDELYKKYNIANLAFGAIHDKLGDAYEEFCVTVLSNNNLLHKYQHGNSDNSLEYNVFSQLLDCCHVTDYSKITHIEATTHVPHRVTRGSSKTDIIMTVHYSDGNTQQIAISSKQSYALKIAFAEFDVDTICSEVGITDARLKSLMLKHQTDKSAKYFTAAEKRELTKLLAPIKREFVRWVITGSTEKRPCDIVFPTILIKFKLQKPKDRYNINVCDGELSLLSFEVTTVEKYIDTILYTNNGKERSAGFGTGLSWTYATGSGGYKIQFKA